MSSKDWAKIKNKETGDVYYFNSATGETSWDKPAVRFEWGPSVSHEPMNCCASVQGWYWPMQSQFAVLFVLSFFTKRCRAIK